MKQNEKSEAMIALLLKTTQEMLLQVGYSRLTTSMIAKHANVSRGALTYHFRSKEQLITAAIDAHLRSVNDDLLKFSQTVEAGKGNLDLVIDHLWELMAGGLFYTTLEYLPEARHNEDFRSQVVPVVKDFHEGLDGIWRALADRYEFSQERTATLMNLTMCVIRGMIAQTIVRYDRGYFEILLKEWKTLLKQEFLAEAQKAGRGQ